jgi:hypothetical protein
MEHRIEADVGNDDFVRASGKTGEREAAGVVDEGGQPELRHLDTRATEEISGGGITDGAGERRGFGGANRRRNQREDEAAECGQPRKRNAVHTRGWG